MVEMISPRRVAKSERGAELIEFALVFPLLLFVVLGIVDFGFLFQRMEVVTNAAREGARIAVLPGYSTPDVKDRVCDYVQGGGVPMTAAQCLSDANILVQNVTITAGGNAMPGKSVSVTFPHQYMFIGGLASWFGAGPTFGTVPVNAVAIMRDELPVPAP
jgi:hypothetical protein